MGVAKSYQKPSQRRTWPLVGIAGFMGAGKDAVADFLVENHGYGKTFMSEPLAEALYRLNPWIPGVSFPERDRMRYQEHVDAVGYTEAKRHPEVRRLLQVLGTEVGRDLIGPDTWTNVASKRLDEIRESQGAVITGIRYPNELEMIRQAGGFMVWVDRPEITAARAKQAELAAHSSETSVTAADCHYAVLNDETLEILAKRTALAARWIDEQHNLQYA